MRIKYIKYLLYTIIRHYFFRAADYLLDRGVYFVALWYMRFYNTPLERWYPRPNYNFRRWAFFTRLTALNNQYNIAWLKMMNALEKSKHETENTPAGR
jgi:hypothetical protein